MIEKHEVEEYLLGTRTDLTSILGTDTESVIRKLPQFKESKISQIKGNRIRVLDKEI